MPSSDLPFLDSEHLSLPCTGPTLTFVVPSSQDPGIAESSRVPLLAGFGIGATLSLILIVQILLYKPAPVGAGKKTN